MASQVSRKGPGYRALISDSHRASVMAMRGEVGAEWLSHLPMLLDDCAARWSLRILEPPGPLWFNYVTRVRRADGSAALLKLCMPQEREYRTEADALRVFDGHGCARLLEVDFDRGAMLLEALVPGTALSALVDERHKLQITADVMRGLWRPVPAEHDFPTVDYWGSGFKRLLRDRFGGTSGPLPDALVSRAEGLFQELLDSQAPAVLLHGDLHWENILAAEREPWLAIDPKGVIGEPAYEPGILLRNDVPREGAPRALAQRIDMLAELVGFDRQRLRAWGFAQAVLSAIWSIHDAQEPGALRAAEALMPI